MGMPTKTLHAEKYIRIAGLLITLTTTTWLFTYFLYHQTIQAHHGKWKPE